MVVKDALLDLLSETDYADITIATLCRKAEISRGTFYLHYDNLKQVMDELFANALGNTHSMLFQIGCEPASGEKCAYPLCRFLRENRKYQPLFFSDTLRSQVIEKIAEVNRDSSKPDPAWMRRRSLRCFCFSSTDVSRSASNISAFRMSPGRISSAV